MSFHKFATLSGAACLAAIVTAGFANAQAPQPTAPPFPELLRQAQGSAPRLLEARADVDVARGHAAQAGAMANPVLSLASENFGVRDFSGLSQNEMTFSVSQLFELGDKRPARIGAGAAEVKAAEARTREREASFAYDLAMAYGLAEAAQRRVKLRADELGRAQEDVRAARALVDAGKEADVHAVQAEAAAAAIEADLRMAEAERVEAFARVSSLAGAGEIYGEIATPLLTAQFAPHTSHAAVAMPPSVLTAFAEREASNRAFEVERSRAMPDVTVSLGVRHFDQFDDTGVVFSFSVPLPLFDRNEGSVDAASASASAASARLAGAQLEAEAARRSALIQAEAGESRMKAATQSETAAHEAYDLARVGYEGGKTPLLEVLSARRALTEAQDRLLDAELARLRAEARLAWLFGQTLLGDR